MALVFAQPARTPAEEVATAPLQHARHVGPRQAHAGHDVDLLEARPVGIRDREEILGLEDAGIVVDVFFDHFLAANWRHYSPITLRQFAKHAHAVFLSNFLILPFRVKQFLPFLIQHKRLESYAQRENLHEVLEIMARRTSLPAKSEWAMQVLSHEYEQFETLFRSFFSEMIDYVETDFGVQIVRPVSKS